MGLFGYKKPDLHGIDRKSNLGKLLYHFALGREGYTKDSDRWDIANALIEMNDKRAVPVLVDMLKSDDPVIVQSGAMVLGPLGDVDSIAPVKEALGRWEHRRPPFPANYLRDAAARLDEVERRQAEYDRRGPEGKVDEILDELMKLFDKLGHRVYAAEFQCKVVSLGEFQRHSGKVTKRSMKRVEESFGILADTVAELKTVHNTLLQVCDENGLEWREVCQTDEEAADLVGRVGDYLAVGSDYDVREILARRMGLKD